MAVSFHKPAGRDTLHHSHTGIITSDVHIDGILQKLRAGPQCRHKRQVPSAQR